MCGLTAQMQRFMTFTMLRWNYFLSRGRDLRERFEGDLREGDDEFDGWRFGLISWVYRIESRVFSDMTMLKRMFCSDCKSRLLC